MRWWKMEGKIYICLVLRKREASAAPLIWQEAKGEEEKKCKSETANMIFLLFPAIQFLMDDVRCGVDVALDDSSVKKAEKNIQPTVYYFSIILERQANAFQFIKQRQRRW